MLTGTKKTMFRLCDFNRLAKNRVQLEVLKKHAKSSQKVLKKHSLNQYANQMKELS